MISITASKCNDEKLEIVRYDLLAWHIWPFEVVSLVSRTLREFLLMASYGICVKSSYVWVQERFVPTGCLKKPLAHRTDKTTAFCPIKTIAHYEAISDYQKAKNIGTTESTVYTSKAEVRSRSDS
jgi:hypothetical protein